MSEPEYYTVGELAHSVGVTVRTIQYYDQAGLLSPSAKGPQNQRLYTEDDLMSLYRILSLKYLGLSLAEIKVENEHSVDNDAFHLLAHRKMDEIEQDFQKLFKRMTTLRALQDKTTQKNPSGIDWKDLVQTIEDHQDESQFFWRLTGVRDDELTELPAGKEQGCEDTVSKWHELIADAIRLISKGEPVDSPMNRELAHRYLELKDSQEMPLGDHNFILMGNEAAPFHGHFAPKSQGSKSEEAALHYHEHGSFDTLRKSVFEHLEKVVESYRQTHSG